MSLDDFIDVALEANRTVGIYPGNANRTLKVLSSEMNPAEIRLIL
jgi:hypothetical protein